MADRILGDLHQDALTRGQRVFNPLGLVDLQSGCVPVHFTGIQHSVAALADVDERSLHAWKHVLHSPEIHVAHRGGLGLLGNVVLHEHPVLQDSDLGPILQPAHDHDAVYAFATRQELGLADHGATSADLAPLAASLTLGFQPGGAAHTGDLVTCRALRAFAATTPTTSLARSIRVVVAIVGAAGPRIRRPIGGLRGGSVIAPRVDACGLATGLTALARLATARRGPRGPRSPG